MRGERVAIAALTPQTVVAMHGCGRKGVRAIAGHQEWTAEDAKRRQHAVLLKQRKDFHTHGIEVARRERIEPLADVIVTGNLLPLSQGRGVIVPSGVLQPALGRQKRRRVREKDAKGAQSGISDGVSGVRTRFAMGRQVSEPSVEDALERLEASGGWHADLLGVIEIVT
jgi:hypothetical protein